MPTLVPISKPTAAPSPVPISDPTESPVSNPTAPPSPVPISDPTLAPISAPTDSPISNPTDSPIAEPTESPVADPTEAPSTAPVAKPTKEPVASPTESPVYVPDVAVVDTPSMIRPFVFTKGVSPDAPPAGVVLIADKDINFLKPGQISNAAYVIGPATDITSDVLSVHALLDHISTIIPGASTKATFYSGKELDGLEYTFTPGHFQALTSFHFHGSAAGNDNANSVFVSSTIKAELPQVALRTKILKV